MTNQNTKSRRVRLREYRCGYIDPYGQPQWETRLGRSLGALAQEYDREGCRLKTATRTGRIV